MDLAAIGAFVAVGEAGGFRSAAATLGMTSSGVSKAVARLEAAVGTELLTRTTRSVPLTPAGAAFHARCRELLAGLEQAGQAAAAMSLVPRGRLTVGMPIGFGRSRVLPVIAAYAEHYPQVEILARLSDRLVDLAEDGVDLAVRIGRLPDSNLVAMRVAQTGYVLCGAPGYLGMAGVPAHPDDLAGHRSVGYVAPGTAARFAYRFRVEGAARTVECPARVIVDDGEALVDLALRSAGLVQVVDYLVADHLAAGRLVRVLRDYEMPPVPVSLVHPPTRYPSPAARALIEMLRRGLRSTD